MTENRAKLGVLAASAKVIRSFEILSKFEMLLARSLCTGHRPLDVSGGDLGTVEAVC